MKKFQISGKTIELDEKKEFLDFFIKDGKQIVAEINLEGMLKAVEKGTIPVDDTLKSYMQYLGRWVDDAPRKREYRKLRKEGYNVLSSEQFFDGENGEEIINNLENTGKFAQYFLEQVFGGVKK